MYLQRFRSCEGCLKPVKRRLSTLQTREDYECYTESYVKCFWKLCDHQTSMTSFIAKSATNSTVVTAQPKRQGVSYKSAS